MGSRKILLLFDCNIFLEAKGFQDIVDFFLSVLLNVLVQFYVVFGV